MATRIGVREWGYLAKCAVLGLALVVGQLRGDGTGSLRECYDRQLAQAGQLQDRGVDVSAAIPFLKDQRNAIRFEQLELVPNLQSETQALLDRLALAQSRRSEAPALEVDLASKSDPIRSLAGNIVIQDPIEGDPRWNRFRREIGANWVQLKLFLHDLNPERSNYAFLSNPDLWRQTVREIHADGGKVMLHLRNIPSRLSLVPEANVEPTDGKGPLSGPAAEAEWREIVREVLSFFKQDPDTVIDCVQLLGELNIGTNWVDPRNPQNRPANPETYVPFHIMTAEAAYAVDPEILVGGPTLWFTSNQELWWDGFLGGLADAGARFDIATVHIYDVNYGIWDEGVALARRKLREFGFADTPIVMTEWNTNISQLDLPGPLRQSHVAASHAVVGFQRLLDQGLGHMYFFLGPGAVAQEIRPGAADSTAHALLLERNGQAVANVNYNAFRLFHFLEGGARLGIETNDDRITALAAMHEDSIEILLAHYQPLNRSLDESQPNTLFTYLAPDWDESLSVTVSVPEIPFAAFDVAVYRIDRGHANISTLGRNGADLAASREVRGDRSGNFQRRIDVPIHGVQLIRILSSRPVNADENENGLPDLWEQTHALNLVEPALVSMADPDGDGLNNLQEFIIGSDPRSRNERRDLGLRILRGGRLQFTSRIAAGLGYENHARRYTVEASDSLERWEALADFTDIPAANGMIEVMPSRSGAQRFFRLRVTLMTAETLAP